MKNNTKKSIRKIVVIGGGTGTYTVLTGLRKYPVDLSVIVSMMDSGGSNRVIRDEFGLLPTSDLRQCIVALSSEKPSEILRELFTYRYTQGTGIAGMTFANLFMAALTDIYGSQQKAIEKTCEFLDVEGEIIPITYDKTNLVALYDNGQQIMGEHEIDEPDENLDKHKIVELSVFPKARVNTRAIEAIMNADMVVLGPGDLYTSILPNVIIEGLAKALAETDAKIVYVMNLMTRFGQTSGYKALDILSEVERYSTREIDFVLMNSGSIPQKALKWYKLTHSFPIKDNLGQNDARIIRDDFVDSEIYEKNKADKLTRSLVRHDPDKLAKAIMSLLE